MTIDFTMEKYENLCSALLDNGYQPLTFSAYVEGNMGFKKSVILRHDIDRKLPNALKMAELENKLGIQSTYYFRYPYTFEPDIIKKIYHLNHEVGYHYEVLSKAKGNFNIAINLFLNELNEFGKICNIKTICMHGSPMSKYDNRDLWKYYDFTNFGIIGEAYLSMKDNFAYFSDSGRTWGPKNKIRDFMKTSNFKANVTDELIELIKHDGAVNQIYILTHPERWASNDMELISYYLKDQIFNIGKKIFSRVRSDN